MNRAEPLAIAEQGAFYVGGERVRSEVNHGADPRHPRYPAGDVVVDALYVSYQIPVDRRYAYPILFNHGGGHSAHVYDTTPDGREGWLTAFLRAGFPTYGVDRVNSGRSGADIRTINEVRLGLAPPSSLPIMNRYPVQSAWESFRWGPRYGEAYPNTQVPLEAIDAYYPQLISMYRDPAERDKMVAGLVALLERVGPATLETWSSSGSLGYLAAARRPDLVKGIVAVEPIAAELDAFAEPLLPALARIPQLIVIGDHAADDVAAARRFHERLSRHGGAVTVDALPEAGIFGNGHTLMLEKNNHQIMERMIAWLDRAVYAR